MRALISDTDFDFQQHNESHSHSVTMDLDFLFAGYSKIDVVKLELKAANYSKRYIDGKILRGL